MDKSVPVIWIYTSAYAEIASPYFFLQIVWEILQAVLLVLNRL